MSADEQREHDREVNEEDADKYDEAHAHLEDMVKSGHMMDFGLGYPEWC